MKLLPVVIFCECFKLLSTSWFFFFSPHTHLTKLTPGIGPLSGPSQNCLQLWSYPLEWAWITSMQCQGLHHCICNVNHFENHQSDFGAWNFCLLFQAVALVDELNHILWWELLPWLRLLFEIRGNRTFPADNRSCLCCTFRGLCSKVRLKLSF